MNEQPSASPVALVTGASGYIGSHLVRRLIQQGWTVHVITRPNSQMPNAAEFTQVVRHEHDGSMQSMIDEVTAAKPNVVFHLASLFLSQHKIEDVEPLIQSNILFGTQLLEGMHLNNIRCIVNTGTAWQHYNNDEYNPVCFYAATKQAFEAVLEYYIQACGFKVVTLKLFDTYGPDDQRPKILNLLRKTISTNETLDLSPGDQLIDLVHIDDVITAYLIAAKRLLMGDVLQHECYGISSGDPIPLKNMVEIVEKLTNSNFRANWGAKSYRYREVMIPWSSYSKLPGWSIKYTFDLNSAMNIPPYTWF